MYGVILDEDSLHPADLDLSQIYKQLNNWKKYPITPNNKILDRIADASVVLTNKVVLNAEILQRSPSLKMIGILATGSNNIDLPAAKSLGITVCNAVRYGTQSVVQHTFALMLALCTRLFEFRHDINEGEWSKSPFFCLLTHQVQELHGKTLVIIGLGELGSGVANIAKAFGMTVMASCKSTEQEHTKNGIVKKPLTELLPIADFISLHCPLTAETHNIINAEALRTMKPTAFLINCARGGLIDEAALIDALKSGKIAGAALDVLSHEPPPSNHILLAKDIPNLLLTPHSAWISREARQKLVDITAENIRQFLNGTPQNVINR